MAIARWVEVWLQRRSEQFPPAALKALKVVGGKPIGSGGRSREKSE